MSDHELDDEPGTMRITSDRSLRERFRDVKTPHVALPLPAQGHGEEVGSMLNEGELFGALRTLLPFSFEMEFGPEVARRLTLVSSDEPPPFIMALREDERGGVRALLDRRRGLTLREEVFPFCGLLGCYRPDTGQVVVYRQGISWLLGALEAELRAVLPENLQGRPLRHLYLADQEQVALARRTYLHWLLIELAILHELAHAMIHLAQLDLMPWRAPHCFESIPPAVHEHLAQSIVATALTSRETVAPFPPSDLTAVFQRLCLQMPSPCRRWALGLPWLNRDEVAPAIRAIRKNRLPLAFTTL